jgi:hypothetical protein
MSLRESVLAAVAAKLVAAGVASGRVYRSRQEAIETLPAVTVEPVAEQVGESVIGLLDRTLSVAVAVLVKGDTPDSAADSLVEAVTAAMMADRTIGLGSEVQVASEHDIRWDFEDFDLARVTVTFQISMRTAA